MERVSENLLASWKPPAMPGSDLELVGEFVRLECLQERHAANLHVANLADGSIWDFLGYGPFPDEAAYAAWVREKAGSEGPQFFAVTDLSVGAPAGVMSFLRIKPESGSIEVGHICLSQQLQRTRAATEAIYLLAGWVFGAGYRRFEWKCNAANVASRRAAQRFGFSYEGVFRQHMIVKGRNRDTAWFAMTDGDWLKLKPAYAQWLDPTNFDATGEQRQRLGDLTAPCRVASDPSL